MKYVLALLTALLLAGLCHAAKWSDVFQPSPTKSGCDWSATFPDGLCTCPATGECHCDVCRCTSRKQLTSDHGTRVWFKLVNGQWVPDEPGWYRSGDFWYRTPSPVMLQHQSMMPSYYPMPSFSGGGSRGGC